MRKGASWLPFCYGSRPNARFAERYTTVFFGDIAAEPRIKRISKSEANDRERWIDAAKDALIHRGIDAVRPDDLAETLGQDPERFNDHFANRAELLSTLLGQWEDMSMKPIAAIDAVKDAEAFTRFEAFMHAWVSCEPYFPVYDSAVRHWGRLDDEVALRVGALDDRRIARLTEIFRDLGHEEEEAFIRARITYFHQIGYYALGIKESSEQRRLYWPLYAWILSGR